jgi:DHA1 family bicyclomycin/chloramphenicol resistance-like MFS transporter
MQRMHLSPGSVWLTVLLGLLLALTPLGTDAYLPALPAMALEFGAPVSAVQLTITTFFLGIAGGQLAWGPLSDRHGRRPVLLAGLGLYLAATIACISSDSIGAIIFWRFVQGLGMSSGPVLSRTIVRDLYSHEHAARMLARMTIVFSIVPIAAPLLGAQLLAWMGWRATFGLLAFMAIVLLAGVAAGLRETAPRERHPVSASGILAVFASVLRERQFTAPFAVMLLSQAGLFAFVTNSAFVLVRALGLSPGEYSVLFAVVMIGQIAGAWFSSRLVMRLGIGGMLRLGTRLACASGLLAAAFAWGGVAHWAAIALPGMAYMFSASCIMPNATAAALSQAISNAGTVSSLMGASSFVLGAAVSVALGALFDGTARPMATGFALAGVAALLAERYLVRRAGVT